MPYLESSGCYLPPPRPRAGGGEKKPCACALAQPRILLPVVDRRERVQEVGRVEPAELGRRDLAKKGGRTRGREQEGLCWTPIVASSSMGCRPGLPNHHNCTMKAFHRASKLTGDTDESTPMRSNIVTFYVLSENVHVRILQDPCICFCGQTWLPLRVVK